MTDWASSILFHRTSSGKTKTWKVYTIGEDWYTETCDYGSGQARVSFPTRCKPKNIGRSNERTSSQAAVDEAKSKMQAKLDEGYAISLAHLVEMETVPRAMLAKPSLEKELARVNKAITSRNCFVQPKLDGFRCLADRRGLWTRNLRKIETCPHIEKALAPLFIEHPSLVIDGELYSHELKSDFGKIQSLLTKTQSNMLEAMEVEDTIRYHVYDFVSNDPFVKRFVQGKKLLAETKFVDIVKTLRVEGLDHLYRKHALFVEEGYEGTIVRVSGVGYEQDKRASQLIKLKEFQDEEFTILAVNEGKGQWAGYAKSITCCMKNSEDTFDAGCRGTQTHLKTVLEQAVSYEGGKATLRFFQKFPSGKPRFPVAIKYFTR